MAMSTRSKIEMGERIIELDELIAREHIEREHMDKSSDDFITSMRNPNTVQKTTVDVNNCHLISVRKWMETDSINTLFCLYISNIQIYDKQNNTWLNHMLYQPSTSPWTDIGVSG